MEKVVKKNQLSLKRLEEEYKSIYPHASKLSAEIRKQLFELIDRYQIPLAFPIEYRVKNWRSLATKFEQEMLLLASVKDLDDLIGLRIILLFLNDLSKVCEVIENTFNIIEKEDKQKRLQENEFGYLSLHYVIELPEPWFEIPSLSLLKGFKAEIQIRTAAQHIWAAASHKLQYKKEYSVPMPVRRSIHRASALLELIDLEFERVLENRAKYLNQVDIKRGANLLNVDSLKRTLILILPKENEYDDDENLSDLLEDLLKFNIDTPDKLSYLLESHLKTILDIDYKRAGEERMNPSPLREEKGRIRIQKGVFYTWVGLTRLALWQEFREEWNKYHIKKTGSFSVMAKYED